MGRGKRVRLRVCEYSVFGRGQFWYETMDASICCARISGNKQWHGHVSILLGNDVQYPYDYKYYGAVPSRRWDLRGLTDRRYVFWILRLLPKTT